MMKQSIFNRELYVKSETIKQITKFFTLDLDSSNTKNFEIKLTREEVVSDHRFYSLGIFTDEPVGFTTISETVTET